PPRTAAAHRPLPAAPARARAPAPLRASRPLALPGRPPGAMVRRHATDALVRAGLADLVPRRAADLLQHRRADQERAGRRPVAQSSVLVGVPAGRGVDRPRADARLGRPLPPGREQPDPRGVRGRARDARRAVRDRPRHRDALAEGPPVTPGLTPGRLT